MPHATLKNQVALVTGASSGLGHDFAHELAQRGATLVLCARRRERLQELADDLTKTYEVDVHVETVDLATPGAGHELAERLSRRDLAVDILVNNAGLAAYGPFLERGWQEHENLLRVDVLALTELSRAFAPSMVERGRGRILLVASVLGYVPTPGYSSYAAAKAYVVSLGETLAFELRGTGVTVTTLSPGSTATEFFDVGGQQLSWFQRQTIMQSAQVARAGIVAMLKGKARLIPGWFNRVQVLAAQFVPSTLLKFIARTLLR